MRRLVAAIVGTACILGRTVATATPASARTCAEVCKERGYDYIYVGALGNLCVCLPEPGNALG